MDAGAPARKRFGALSCVRILSKQEGPTLKTLRSAFWSLLLLGRVSNLPTVWSNCLAAWLLGGGGAGSQFACQGIGATLLYLGGMFLNDAFDVQFDRRHRPNRPIPSGAIAEGTVWLLGAGMSVGGFAVCCLWGGAQAGLGILLLTAIVVYDALHKRLLIAPLLMAECRFLLYLMVASAANGGVSGLVIWSALALASYVTGLSFVARTEATGGVGSRWWAGLLLAPALLASLVNAWPFREGAQWVSLGMMVWSLISLRHIWWSDKLDVGRTVSGLLAGIVWVDWLAVVDRGPELGFVFAGLFLLARWMQRVVPAT